MATKNEILKDIENDFISLMKEYASLKVELRKSKESMQKDKEGLLLGLIEVLDNFDVVFENIQLKKELVNPQMKIWVGNFKAVRKKFENILKENGVLPISCEGPAQPGFHIIEDVESRGDIQEEIILKVLFKGYLINGNILRKATVIVAKNTKGE